MRFLEIKCPFKIRKRAQELAAGYKLRIKPVIAHNELILRDAYKVKKIVISGSMALLEKMKSIASQLIAMGYAVILPEEMDWEEIPKAQVSERKKELSMEYFNEIAKEDTYAILVVNDTKEGKANYIGASTFAEIALAFYFSKKTFLLNDIYEPYKSELSAWGVIPLNGELTGVMQPHINQETERT